jgi:hypothetical protein
LWPFPIIPDPKGEKMRTFLVCVVCLTTLALAGWSWSLAADEQEVPLDKLPGPVMETAKRRFPKAQLLHAAKESNGGKTEYEVTIKEKGKKIDLTLTAAGVLILIEKEIDRKDLPQAVLDTLEKKYPGAKYKTLEEVIRVKDGEETLDFYEAHLETADKKKVEAKVGPDGKFKGEEKAGAEQARRWTKDFDVDKTQLVSRGCNPYFILEPGYQLVLENEGEKLTVTVLDKTRIVDGVECRIVEEREIKGGKEIEKSNNYFAICKRSNSVFYFGEDVGGAWLSGEKGAKFGLMMPGLPLLGARWYEEYAPGVGQDRAEIVAMGVIVKTPAGVFKNCVKVVETNPLEPGSAKEFKYYAPGIGMVQEGQLKLVRYGKVDVREAK